MKILASLEQIRCGPGNPACTFWKEVGLTDQELTKVVRAKDGRAWKSSSQRCSSEERVLVERISL